MQYFQSIKSIISFISMCFLLSPDDGKRKTPGSFLLNILRIFLLGADRVFKRS